MLKPGGYLVFTDIMQSDDCDVEQMESVLARIHLDDMGSPRAYKQWGVAAVRSQPLPFLDLPLPPTAFP